jgi:hypothetical protein
MVKKKHKGQVALILVLIMTVVSALAVSLASRSTIDTKIQEAQSEGVQALLFAQSGLEQLIMNPADSTAQNANYSAVMSETGGESLEIGLVSKGTSVELNLSGADFSRLTGFVVFWGPPTGSSGGQPAVYISVVDNSGKVTSYAYDYLGVNGFTRGTDVTGNYPKSTAKIGLTSDIAKVTITVLGATGQLKIVPMDAGAVFPPQVKSIKSVGTVQSDNKTVKYGLQYDESYVDTVPSVFNYALFSDGSIFQ